ncbi:MAG TPA: hypothetical protein VGW78_07580 [Candidatus Babeliales bacterium]|jgi:hypothetical protein|nr:hypothetical protein [Candidatus Babeliales bacterium]
MTNAVQKFDPSLLMEGVKDRVKTTFVSLIPDEQWEEMIKNEYDNFFKVKETGYSNREYKSDFQILVRNVMSDVATKKVQEFLAKYEHETWGNSLPQASETLKELLIKHAPEIFTSMFKNMFQNSIYQMQRQ